MENLFACKRLRPMTISLKTWLGDQENRNFAKHHQAMRKASLWGCKKVLCVAKIQTMFGFRVSG
jgi:hypothetical protein